MKQAILNGLEIVDKYYEKVEIPASDSEDETDEPSVIFQPVDQYSDRPLPYIIGSTEWHKHWHVGLLESSSDSEVENPDEEFSESETEDIRKIPNERSEIPGISSESESEPERNKINQPGYNDNMFGTSSESETGSAQINTPANNSFAAELAAKLGKVENSTEPEINKRPIQKSFTPGLFPDEPPPLNEDTKPIKSGMFSGGEGLFDDDEEEADDFWAPKEKIKAPVEKKEEVQPKRKVSGGLFDDDDDDLFSVKQKNISAPLKQSLFDDEPPEIEPAAVNKKIVGGVSLFANNNSLIEQVI